MSQPVVDMVHAGSSEAAEAYAFRQLVAHLQMRTDVQNIELMILSGFCRNCLSKWYHVGAAHAGIALSYDDACERVYGMPYAQWKKTHQSKATDEQLRRLEETKAGHAKHAPVPPVASTTRSPGDAGEVAKTSATAPPAPTPPSTGMADVCCIPAEELVPPPVGTSSAPMPAPPSADEIDIRLGVLTVSDRAAQGAYADISGPEVVRAMQEFAATPHGKGWRLTVTRHAVVADEVAQIDHALRTWSKDSCEAAGRLDAVHEGSGGGDDDDAPCNLILTTGGTGMSPRDVTPEVTSALLDRSTPGIPELLLREAIKHEPLAALSRAVAGIRGSTLIVNLPGRPKAVRENLAVLMPLLGHALCELLDG